jgi:hypothetical protein
LELNQSPDCGCASESLVLLRATAMLQLTIGVAILQEKTSALTAYHSGWRIRTWMYFFGCGHFISARALAWVKLHSQWDLLVCARRGRLRSPEFKARGDVRC